MFVGLSPVTTILLRFKQVSMHAVYETCKQSSAEGGMAGTKVTSLPVCQTAQVTLPYKPFHHSFRFLQSVPEVLRASDCSGLSNLAFPQNVVCLL